MEWLPLLLSGVSSLASGWMGANAANKATKATTAALEKAMQYDKETLGNVLGLNTDTTGKVLGLNKVATDKSIEDQTNAYQGARQDLAPWMTAGADALEAYSGELGLTQPGGQPYVSKFRETPGYQFAKSEGEKSVVNNMRALGLGGSGAAMKALTRYGQGYADQNYGQYMDRLSGVSQHGQAASTDAASLGMQSAGNIANTRMGGAANASNAIMTGTNNATDAILNRGANISDNIVNGGMASGAGTVAGTNAWTSSLKDFTNSLGRTLGSTKTSWGNILGANNYAGGVT